MQPLLPERALQVSDAGSVGARSEDDRVLAAFH